MKIFFSVLVYRICPYIIFRSAKLNCMTSIVLGKKLIFCKPMMKSNNKLIFCVYRKIHLLENTKNYGSYQSDDFVFGFKCCNLATKLSNINLIYKKYILKQFIIHINIEESKVLIIYKHVIRCL